jgi:predicted HAD superfamily Cof-like phosphohydrolase
VAVADALADIEYVVRGTGLVHGLPTDAVFAEVHRSNMTKTNRPDLCKLVKGPGYQPPNLPPLLWPGSYPEVPCD